MIINMFNKVKEYFGYKTKESNLSMFNCGYNITDDDRNLVKLSTETWAYVCATYVANAVSSSKYKLYGVTRNGDQRIRVPSIPVISNKQLRNSKIKLATDVSEIISHPLISLLENPNPRQTKYEFLAETQIFIDTIGDAYWYIVYNNINIPEYLYILPSQYVKPKVDKAGNLLGYIYNPKHNLVPLEIPLEDIIHFRSANVRDRYTGMGCLEAAYKSSILLESMNDLEISLNKNMAVPSFIVKYKDGSLDPNQRKLLEAEWNSALQGIRKTGKIKVADENFDIQNLGLSPREMQFLAGRKWSREEICAAYRVPISLVTSEAVNRATAESGLYQFSLYGIYPRLELLEQTINKDLIPKYNEPRIFLEFENPVPKDRQFELEKLKVAQGLNIYTQEELKLMIEAL